MTSLNVKSLVIKQKIKAVFSDGTEKSNQTVSSTAALLSATRQTNVSVTLGTDGDHASPHSKAMLDQLASAISAEIIGNGIQVSMKWKAPEVHYIRLGPNAIYNKTADAVKAIDVMSKTDPAEGAFVGLTKAFDKGSVEGQIRSIFNFVKDHGTDHATAKAKVRAFATKVRTDQRYAGLLEQVLNGTSPDAVAKNTTQYFQFWFIMRAYGKMGPAPEVVSTEVKTEVVPAAESKTEAAPAEAAA